jgi:pimeloyl-ACP methyl ester carboxylesterase
MSNPCRRLRHDGGKEDNDMAQVISADGTAIGYQVSGNGPGIIMVGGATQYRTVDGHGERLAAYLAPRFTVLRYDRRGRGESGDTRPYAVAREIEDIHALIGALGGKACLFGLSSGAVLALEAANAHPDAVRGVFAYEPPVNVEQTPEQAWAGLAEQEAFRKTDDGRGAMLAFMRSVGTPEEQVQGFAASPGFAAFAAVGLTIAHDFRIMAAATADGLDGRWPNLTMPVAIACGTASFPFMEAGADVVAAAIPGAERIVVPGQGHDINPDVLAPLLQEFFSRT